MMKRKRKSPTVLPTDILMEIISRLPIYTILQCSRPSSLRSITGINVEFNRIVKNPHFAKLFQRHHNNNITSPSTFMGFYDNSSISYLIEYEKKNNTLVFTHKFDTNCLVPNNDKDSRIIMSNLHVLCSCNGVLLVRYIHKINDGTIGRLRESLLLVNPVTRRCYTAFEYDEPSLIMEPKYGLGYSQKSGQYKVVRFTENISERHRVLEVLTLLGNSKIWRTIGTYDDHDGFYNVLSAPVLVNDSLHWLTSHGNSILRFDIDTEVFEFFPTPYNDEWIMNVSFLSLLDGLLCVGASSICTYNSSPEIWVMKEYGVMSSWFRVSVMDDYYYGESLEFIQVLDNGKILMISRLKNNFVIFDIGTRKRESLVMEEIDPDLSCGFRLLPFISNFLSLDDRYKSIT
ncbi:hypothetical protein BVRB_7g159820 [Beta vulgaris subsp. vulgaris]|nr:hypothetical protein BVRB_7g159820 [Beta vulgaris subsp. vulgaris]